MADNVDFDEEGRKILDSLNLPKFVLVLLFVVGGVVCGV